jgi:hypothetical protein
MHAIRWTAGLLALTLALAAGPGAAAEPSAGQPGVWKPQSLDFDYMGFTDHYTCDGLHDRMRVVLRELGARKDMNVMSYGCSSDSTRRALREDRFPAAKLDFAALFPQDAAPAPDAAGDATAGAWKSVNLVGSGKLDPEECELIEQVVREVLPHFAVRKVEQPQSCVPHQSTRTYALRLEVFAPVTAAAP